MAISKPKKPMVPPPFYEPYWTDQKLIQQSLEKGKIIEGRLFFDPNLRDKSYGFVKADPLVYCNDKGEITKFELLPIKIWGIRHLNRCFHLDKVYVKLVNWIEWGKAGNKLV